MAAQKTKRIAVIDFETTGLIVHPKSPINRQPEPIEFGGVIVTSEGQAESEFEVMIKPESPIPAEVQKITGINNAMVAGASPFRAVWPNIRGFLDGIDALVAHNLMFDASILAFALGRLPETERDWQWPKGMLCTVELFQEAYGSFPRLVRLYEDTFGHKFPQEHRALSDVYGLVELVIEYRLWHLVPRTERPLPEHLKAVDRRYQ